jgi:CubicO group peptidase (beta-lactamase class C family)
MDLHDLIRYAHEQNLHILHIIVRQNGEITAKHDFVEETPVHLWSVSKTFTSMAIGIAAHEGYFQINDKIEDTFPAAAREKFDQITIRDLLCMATGQAESAFDKALNAGRSLDDIEGLFFEEPIIHAPGRYFLYNNAATLHALKTHQLENGHLFARLCTAAHLRANRN